MTAFRFVGDVLGFEVWHPAPMDDLEPTEPVSGVDDAPTHSVTRPRGGSDARGSIVGGRWGVVRLRDAVRGWFARAPKRAIAADEARGVPVTIQSRPSGAFVTVVTDGRVSPLGPTPLRALLDPERPQDVIVSKQGFETELRRVPVLRTHLIVFHLRRVP
jgi:hypothetical protein